MVRTNLVNFEKGKYIGLEAIIYKEYEAIKFELCLLRYDKLAFLANPGTCASLNI